MPGSTTQVRFSGSTEISLLQYFDQSRTTPVLQHWPASDVPPPREKTGTSWRRHTAIADTASSTSRGTTAAVGTCR